MYRVTEILDFSYGHRLLRYRGSCAHLHGHNGRVEIVISSDDIDERAMVADFCEINRIVRSFVEENLDHRMLLHRDDPLVGVLKHHDQPLFLMDHDPTAEAIARLIYEHAASRGLPVHEIRLWETRSSMASYTRPGR